ncbi:MAG: NADH-quinone oxidoreductase subunit NuoK [Zetaproteobacteria bacterium]|nr:MAG: NADH-quinone oxidoreductase subunit NuoK [Zetaproteobacteria bacterium]
MTSTVGLSDYLLLGAILFSIAVVGLFLNRKNLLVFLMCIELMFLAVNLNLVAFSMFRHDLGGQIFVFFILTVAASEIAVGLGLIVALYRTRRSIEAEDINTLQG